ncbi:hypothetical protein B0T18DRAFT_165014 [Schizothecium vesticola]|uniref:Fungal N-terminal domain-containing protein n=1 Tax=Schizothecium vesticola TaxID=314040 RepID=A0AA40EWY9_9PEZI|nr:hypothetical protein B0T18DRAFT_165014 [Schizothecium vesticola]
MSKKWRSMRGDLDASFCSSEPGGTLSRQHHRGHALHTPARNPTMADPLSVAASVAGLLTAAAAICKVLAPYASAVRDTPQVALQVRAEIEEASIFLGTLQGLASNLATLPTQRTLLIQVDHVVAILTNGVLVFSDLETCVGDLPTPDVSSAPALRRRLQWTRKENDLKPILGRLQGFKASVSMILGILQSNSLLRAEQWQTELSSNVADLLTNNQDLSRRLMCLEAAFDAQSCITIRPDAARIQEINGTSTLAPSVTAADERRDDEEDPPDAGDSGPPWISSFEFEDDLNFSMPYRRAKRDIIDASPRNSVAFSEACWSMVSGISLGKISTLAVICLPVYAEEISNSQHYQFTGQIEPVLEHKGDLATMQQEEFNMIRRYFENNFDSNWTCLEHQSSPGSLLYYDGAIRFTPRPLQSPTSEDRLYIFTNNIVVVRDRTGVGNNPIYIFRDGTRAGNEGRSTHADSTSPSRNNDVALSVGRLPFSHVVSIRPLSPVAVKTRRLSFLPLALAPRGSEFLAR